MTEYAKRKICLVIPSLQVGGMQRVMAELARYFCRQVNLEVHIVIYGKQPEVFYSLPGNLIVHKPKSIFKDTFRLISAVGRMIFLRNIIKKINPDSVLSFGEYWNSFVLLSLYGLHYPVFISDRCSPEVKFGTIHFLIRKWLYPRAKGIIAQTEKAKQLYSSQFRQNNICVIGNPVRQILLQGNQIPKDDIVLTVGRLIDSKHHDKLIKVFLMIPYKNWKLIIVGDDALKQNNQERLRKLIDTLDCKERVILAGSQKDIDCYYLKSKIFAFMSSSEGFPNVIGEAMSAGLSVISFDCIAGPSEMIHNNENGFLIPLGNDDLFREKLNLLMENESIRERFGVKAKTSISRFSIDRIGLLYYNLISESWY